ncbi:MAG: PIN domain-containing protein [Xanthomonadales bacterium]|nr:PIN domain-containing protein [Xanthomonadales bacterium]
MKSVLLDAGPWLALFHGADRQHARMVEWLRREGSAIHLVSTWPVLTEVCFFLRAETKQRVLAWVARGAVEMVALGSEELALMERVIGRFADQRPDLADASLLAVAERRGLDEVATLDLRDFGTYRIGQDRRLRLVDFDAAPRAVRVRRR